MIKLYEWKNVKTGKIVEHDHWSEPPDLPGKWQRVYSVAIGRVPGASGSPGMPSTKLRGSKRANKDS